MQKLFTYLLSGLMGAALCASPAMAKGNGKGAKKEQKHDFAKKDKKTPPGHAGKPGKGAKHHKDDVEVELWVPAIRVEEAHRLALRHHCVGHKPLPPGIRKNLMRGKPLPPGIAKKHLPGPYLSSLPIRPGYEWAAYGTDLVLISVTSNVVAHVIVDALR